YFDDDDDAIRVTTSQVIHKPGDPIAVRIEATIKTGTVYVDIVSGWTVVESRYTALRNGRAEIQIPYSEKFKGELKVAAYMEEPGDVDDIIESTFGVIYPSRQGISVEASFDKAIYKPNEEASVKFGVIDAVGTAVESALGVVVFDRAVEERARTDADFAGVFRGLSGWLGYGGAFAGVNVKDLNELDLTKPISPEIQLVAELILHDVYYDPKVFHSKSYYDEAKSIFASSVSVQMQPVANAMRSAYELQNHLHATNENGLRSILERYGVDFDDLRDPWGTQYVAVFSIDKTRDIVTIKSLGPDKTLATDDDFTAYTAGFEYFTPIGRAIDTAVNNYNARTGKFIRDEQTLFAELGIRELRDRFGRPYKIVTDSDGRYLQLRVQSDGPGDTSNDDFFVWTSRIEFFAGVSKKIAAIQSAVKRAPTTESAFRSSLKEKGVDLDNVRDGNNNPVYVVVDQRSRHWDRVTFETVRDFGDEKSVERRLVTPVTQQIMQFTIRGVGRDGKQGTYDDVTLTQIVHVLSEQAKDDPKPVTVVRPVRYASGTGMIAGTISDASGAAVPAATVTATNSETGHERSVTSNDEGKFLIANLPVGTYTVKVTAPNFKHSIVQNVRVNAGTTTNVDVTVEVGSVDATVDVAASGELDQTTNASATSITSEQLLTLPINARNAMNLIALQPGAAKGVAKSGERDDSVATEQQTSTPRLREYFPETLFWAPEIVTSADGRAEVKFRMADNITTWKMYTIASTKNGRIGVGEKEVAAFQAFFVDLDPPKFLTTGDEIFLPTQVRNYTDKKQDVKVTMSPAGWFHFLDNETQRVAVDSGGSENAVFGFRAIIPTIDGRQRVTATAEAESDAIERPVTVRPNGRQVVHTDSKYFAGSERFEINFPANALPNTRSVELKVYPNLMAHVAESVEGLLQRPYGCGEQTISSTYPNVMILKFAMSGASGTRRISDPVERKARKYLQSGYERLLGYQVADGGFSYWGGKDAADFALTAYALRFLSDASAFITIDPQSVKRAEDWLIRQQQADGSWNKKYHWETAADEARAKSTTTYVARTLAMLKASGKSDLRDAALNKALSYLRTRNAELDDPYALSLFGLAALDSGDDELARRIAQKLVSLAKYENSAAYWNLESNTAFNGWGTAGRIETTALVTQLFLRLKSEPGLVGKGMLFLLKNKDRYGVWYSTQTTINVLDTFVASLASSDQKGAQQVQVFVNGDPLTSIEIAPDKLEQIVVDLDGKLSGDRNTL
ncbi:MAG TPA: alpha-2-macroglobulin family protein, partial [Pyrinomonadaceae bacterium]